MLFHFNPRFLALWWVNSNVVKCRNSPHSTPRVQTRNNAAAATRNITKAWGKGTVNERTTQRWFKKFGLGDTTLRTQPGYGGKSDVDDGILK
ncbi:hypothetical protein Y032_0730g1896 [Ancylostoma ceylanicum]|uniref:Mos1 transposase HTH domain-containing protein n=1 Tax=Ancylostoma ceylanicum TaxID=53326 RepID=A0A016WEI7_9BILA|nr:hypothetical protein Y032_0730g1896 [Ancylostoma ceylanicum]